MRIKYPFNNTFFDDFDHEVLPIINNPGKWLKYLHTHVYYNAIKAMKLRENLFAHVTLLKERANPASELPNKT